MHTQSRSLRRSVHREDPGLSQTVWLAALYSSCLQEHLADYMDA